MKSKRKGTCRLDLRDVWDSQGNRWTVCNDHYMRALINGRITRQTVPGVTVRRFCDCCEALSLFTP